MNRPEAEHWAVILAQHGYDVAMVCKGGRWYVVVLSSDVVTALYNGAEVQAWLSVGNHPIKLPRAENRYMTSRHLYCTHCRSKYSADPSYYRGRGGILACCGRALQLWQVNLGTKHGNLIAESVDAEYLMRPHTDDYGSFAPLPLTAERLTGIYPNMAVERTMGIPAPRTPKSLRDLLYPKSEPGLTPEQLGYALHVAGYRRMSGGVWARGEGIEYQRFEDGDRIDHGVTPPVTAPFEFVLVRQSEYIHGERTNLYRMSIKEDQAA